MVEHSRDSLIWVQIQYRLGAYEFLGECAMKDAGDANLGFLDQRMALEWVKKTYWRVWLR